MARPTNLTRKVFNSIIGYIRRGNFIDAAARRGRVPLRTLRRWLKRGREEEGGLYVRFWHAVQEAEGQAEIDMVGLVTKAAREDPLNARWWLERKCPHRWGSQSREIRALKKEVQELQGTIDALRSSLPASRGAAAPPDRNGHAAAGGH